MTTKNKTRLGCESLETREVPATLSFSNGVLTITGTSGKDWLTSSSGNSSTSSVEVRDYSSGSGVGVLVGNYSNVSKVVFNGNGGDDRFSHFGQVKLVADGGSGNDSIKGGYGNDTIKGGLGADALTGDWGNDTLWGGDNNDALYGGKGDDIMYGEAGDDYLTDWIVNGDLGYLEGGSNYLYGGIGTDTLVGGSEQDYLDGGKDGFVDSLTGNHGADTFVAENYKIGIKTINRDYPKDSSAVEGDKIIVPSFSAG